MSAVCFSLSGPKKSPLTTSLIHHPVVVDGGYLHRLVFGDEYLLRHTKDSYRDLQGLVMPSCLLYLSSSLLIVSISSLFLS